MEVFQRCVRDFCRGPASALAGLGVWKWHTGGVNLLLTSVQDAAWRWDINDHVEPVQSSRKDHLILARLCLSIHGQKIRKIPPMISKTCYETAACRSTCTPPPPVGFHVATGSRPEPKATEGLLKLVLEGEAVLKSVL